MIIPELANIVLDKYKLPALIALLKYPVPALIVVTVKLLNVLLVELRYVMLRDSAVKLFAIFALFA